MNCPECGSPVIMNDAFSKYAGTWECSECSASGSCEHDNIEVEMIASSFDPSEEEPAYVCQDCGVVTDGDPRADAYDDMVDTQIDMARGK